MQWEVVSLYLLLALVVVLVIGWAVFGRRIRKAAAAKGTQSGLDLSQRVKLGDLGKISQVLVFEDSAAAPAVIAAAVATNKRVSAAGESRWTLRVVQPDDIVFEWATDDRQLRLVSSRESLGTVTGGREWSTMLKSVEQEATNAGVTVSRAEAGLQRSTAAIAGDHVWTRA